MADADTNTENFEEVFDKLLEMGDKNASDSYDNTQEPRVELSGGDEQEEISEPDDENEEEYSEEETSEEEYSEPEEEEETPYPSSSPSEDVIERFANLMRTAEERVQQGHPQEQAQAEPAPQEFYNDEEKKFLTEFEKDWPDVQRYDALRRRADYNSLVSYVFQEVAKEISPLLSQVRTVSERSHLDDLYNAVQDYDDVRDKVIEWAGKQPAYLQPAYQHVIQQGTVDEVADLVDRFRQATGYGAQSAPAPAARRRESELPTATKQAAAALAPVSSKRSAVIQAQDPADFDSAFASFADKF